MLSVVVPYILHVYDMFNKIPFTASRVHINSLFKWLD